MESSGSLKTRTKILGRRKGAATVELAVCIPMMVVIVLGSIEASNMMFLKQTMIQAAYEGAKVAILNDGSNDKAIQAIDAVTDGRRLSGVEIQFDPANVEASNPGEFVTVTVSAPGDANSFLKVNPFSNSRVSATAVMVRE